MKIVMLSDHESLGGAAQSTCRLAEALARTDEVVRVCLFPDGRPHPWQTHVVGIESPLARQLRRVPRRFWPRRFPRPATPAFVAGQLRRLLKKLAPDVINVHNLHAGVDWGWGPHLAAVCAEAAPVVWTLHDMWSFTGRCAYSYECEKFRSGCDAACPTPNEAPRLAPAHIAAAWKERRHLFAAHAGLIAVTPSRWLASEGQRGLWAGHRIEVIPYGIPTDRFSPLPREEARQQLGISAAGPVLLLAAYDLTERRKGADLLPHFWQHVRRRPLTVLTMGHGRLDVADPQFRVHPLGWLDDDRAKALAYSAADALLHAAPVDNFPNVLLEAFACGTPAIGLPIGGVAEQIRPGVSGWLAAAVSPEALGHAIDVALDDHADLRGACRALAQAEFPLGLQAERYRQLFSGLRRP